MLIVGAKGFAKEVLQVLIDNKYAEDLAFYDDQNPDVLTLFEEYPILSTSEQVSEWFDKKRPNFTIGVGGPKIRHQLYEKFSKLNGVFSSTISQKANIGSFEVSFGDGVNLMTGSTLTNSIRVGTGALINLHCTIGHDCVLGDFVELSPGVHISGNCKIGHYANIGTNAVVLPGVTVGNECIIGAGAVVNKNVPDKSVAVGVPAKVIKRF